MKIKMAINSQPSTTESKKQTEQTTRTETESDMEGYQLGGRKGRIEERVQD